MKRAAGLAVVLSGSLLLAACSQGPRPYRGPPLKPVAQSGEVVAAELGFARMAQDEGQWTAFAEYAARDAVMFVPQAVNAQVWLKGQANPPQAVRWQPHKVWSSCDGTLAMVKGAWQQPDGKFGYYTTIWQRQDDTSYKWVLDQGEALDAPIAEPEMIRAQVADCKAGGVAQPVRGMGGGASDDKSLSWSYSTFPDGSRSVSILMLKDGQFETVYSAKIAAKDSAG